MLGILALGSFATPAVAQVTVEAAVQTDLRHRGYSLSGERPVAIASLGYDDASGAYVGGSAIGMVKDREPAFLGAVGNVGYARRVLPGLSLDVGVMRAEYQAAYRYGADYGYTEVYAGAALRNVSARVHFSPDYYGSDRSTVYVEVDGGIELARDWHLGAHVGSLTYLERPAGRVPRREYDWRLGLTRRLGGFDLFAEASGRLRGRAYRAGGRSYEKTALVFGLSRAF